jgi:hypothetical protein
MAQHANSVTATASAYTPGPWTYDWLEQHEPTDIAAFRIDSTVEWDTVADVFEQDGEGRAGANARLIAAAPELLEALDYLLAQTVDQELAFGIELTEGEKKAHERALSAIAKATGAAA